MVAPDEWKSGTVRVKQQVGKEAGAGDKGEVIGLAQLSEHIKQKLSAIHAQ